MSVVAGFWKQHCCLETCPGAGRGPQSKTRRASGGAAEGHSAAVKGGEPALDERGRCAGPDGALFLFFFLFFLSLFSSFLFPPQG